MIPLRHSQPNVMNIPTIDMSPFMGEDGVITGDLPTAGQQKVAERIDEAFSENGFLFLSNLGVSTAELESYFEMTTTLFEMPQQHKEYRLRQYTPESNLGYLRQNSESLNNTRKADVKEGYSFQHPKSVKQEHPGCPEGFGEFCEQLWGKMEKASQRFAVACGLALNLPSDYFSKTLNYYNSAVIRLSYFPPSEYDPGKSTGEDPSASLRVSEHIDWGIFTILFNNEPGLQVKTLDEAEYENGHTSSPGWLNMPVPQGSTAIVNTGSLICRWTNDYWKAPAHRVIIANPEQGRKARISIGCFFHPDEDEIIGVDKKFVKAGEKAKYADVTTKEYILAKVEESRSRY